jgi:hypothetical protein
LRNVADQLYLVLVGDLVESGVQDDLLAAGRLVLGHCLAGMPGALSNHDGISESRRQALHKLLMFPLMYSFVIFKRCFGCDFEAGISS